MTSLRARAAVVLLTTATVLAACGGDDAAETSTDAGAATDSAAPDPGGSDAGGSDAGGSDAGGTDAGSGEPVTMTWWHNANAEPGRQFFADVAAEFEEAHPNVTMDVVPTQNEDLRTKIQVALQSDPPDIFQQWGGGEMAAQVDAGKLMDLSDPASDTIDSLGGAVSGWQVEGATYGLPYTIGAVGFWYDSGLLDEAGVSEPPASMDDLYAAIDALRAADITPIAVGGGDLWPAAFYYNYGAVRSCSQEALEAAGLEFDFSDECFVRAGEMVQELVAAQPFQEGFLAASAQQGASSSAGLLANGNAAMELMGQWNPSVMQGLTDGDVAGGNLGWFPYPSADGDGAQGALIGGGDGMSCSADAPPECVDFLEYLVSDDVQTRFAEVTGGLPVAEGATGAIEDENLRQIAEARADAPYVQIYLDVAYGPNVGGALNEAVGNLIAEQGSPQDIVDAMQAAADSE